MVYKTSPKPKPPVPDAPPDLGHPETRDGSFIIRILTS